MKNIFRLQRFVTVSIIFIALVAFAATDASATHLRGTTLSWAPTGVAGQVKFTVKYAQRWSQLGNPGLGTAFSVALTFGDNTSGTASGTITSTNNAEDWFVADLSVTHNYAGPGPYTAFYTSGNRISTLKLGHDTTLRMETTVRPQSGNSSPVASMPPVITIPIKAVTGFAVSATDINRDTLHYRLATTEEMFGAAPSAAIGQPPGLSINSATGQVSWDTTAIPASFGTPAAGDLWAVQVMVEDLDGLGNAMSKIPIDVILKFVTATGNPPTLTINPAGPLSVKAGTPVTFTVTGNDVDPGRRITLNATGIPIGATATNLNQTLTPPVTSTFTWTPTLAQGGSYAISFTVTDDTLQQALKSISIFVEDNQPPTIGCPAPVTAQFGQNGSVSVQVADPNGDALTVVWMVDGVVVHTDNVPASPHTTTVTLTRDFGAVGSHTVAVTVTDPKNASANCSTTVAVNKADQTINFPTISTPAVGDSPFTISATATSGLPVGFALISGAATLNGNTVAVTDAGFVTIRATQGGDAIFSPALSVDRTFTVNPAVTAASITSSANPSTLGQPVTFTATVTGPSTTLPGQIGHWTLDEPSGSTAAADSSGSGNNASCGGSCPTFGAAGVYGGAAAFDGSSNVLRVNNTIGGTFSASVWVKTSATGGGSVGNNAFAGNGIIWSDIGGAANDMVPMALVADRLAFGTGENNGFGYDTITSSVPINSGNWIHLVVTRDMTSGAKQIYVNGVLDASGAGATGLLNANGILALGANTLDNRYFNGAIDDIQFFNRVLSASDVHTLYTGGLDGAVTFNDGATMLGTAQVSGGGIATLTTSTLSLGGHPVTANYGGNGNYAGSASAVLNQIVNQGSTTTTLTSSSNPSTYGQSVTFTASVSVLAPGTGTPSGSITFKEGATTLGTGALNGSGQATFATSALPAGSHSIIAEYGGDASSTNSTSAALAQMVNPAGLTITADNQTKVYGAALPPLTVTYAGFVNGDTASTLTTAPALTTTANAASHVAGSPYSITASSAVGANYTISYVNGTLTVTAANLIITAVDQSKTYGAPLPALTASYSGLMNGDTSASLTTQPTLTTTATTASHVGGNPFSITASGAVDSDYAISYVAGILTVNAAPLTITADNKSKAYGGLLPPLTASYDGLVNSDTSASLTAQPTLTTTATAASHVAGNPYSITASGAVDADYTISYAAGTLTVTSVPLTITANNQTKMYGAPLSGLTAGYNGLVNGDTPAILTAQPTLTTTATAASHVAGNPYSITASGAVDADYTISYVAGTLTVAPAPLMITAGNQTKAYGAPLLGLTASYIGLVNGDTSASLTTPATLNTTATAASHVNGSPYAITVGGAVDPDYAISYTPGTLTLTLAPLTVTANNVTRQYGLPNPAFSAGYAGFVNGDTTASLGGTLSSTTTATPASSVGSYPITPAGFTSGDYSITFTNGTLTVATAPVTATADAKAKVYGLADPGLTYQVSGALYNGDNFSGAMTRTPGEIVAAYPILKGTLALSTNYTLTYVSANLVINPAATATIVSSSLNASIYGQIVTFTATVSRTITATIPGTGVPPGAVTFFDGATTLGTGTLNPSGVATVSTQWLVASNHPITAVYGPAVPVNFITSSTALMQTVNKAATATGLTTSLTPAGAGTAVTFTATLTVATAGVPTGTITFSDGSTVIGTAAGLNGAGQYSFTTTTLGDGVHSIVATYSGDGNFLASTSTPVSELIYAYPAGPAGGTFVIGDRNAAVGAQVTFWGAQWAKVNSTSGGSAPSAFKGFALSTSTQPPVNGGLWAAEPGNSAVPPTAVPAYIGVIVSSLVTQSGSTISGNIPQMVVVKTNAGYGPDPGHAGTGTVVAIIQ